MISADFELFLKSIIVGLSIAIPVGPIAILCINRTLSGGKLSGLVSGLGAAAADTFYGALVAFGVSFVSQFLAHNKVIVRLIGGLILIALGLRTFLSRPSTQVAVNTVQSLLRDFLSAFFLTLANPLTIFAFFASFAAFNIHRVGKGPFDTYIIIAGILVGSVLWWTVLAYVVGLFYKEINAQKMKLINTFSGILITIFGLVVLMELVLKVGKL